MDYLSTKLAVPLASDGWQMFQPPLYYALSVLYARPLSGMLSSDWLLVTAKQQHGTAPP